MIAAITGLLRTVPAAWSLCSVTAFGLLASGTMAVPAQGLNSDIVLQRYASALTIVEIPTFSIYEFTISQSGPLDIEQHHLVYRHGAAVRDETLSDTSKVKATVIARRIDRYAIERIAPRPSLYAFVFVRQITVAGAPAYLYATTPYARGGSGFVVTEVAIDAKRFLPRMLEFRSTNGVTVGNGTLEYLPAGKYWMPVSAVVTAMLGGRPASERISWSGYRFPQTLPALTFTR